MIFYWSGFVINQAIYLYLATHLILMTIMLYFRLDSCSHVSARLESLRDCEARNLMENT